MSLPSKHLQGWWVNAFSAAGEKGDSPFDDDDDDDTNDDDDDDDIDDTKNFPAARKFSKN